jgi:hypothetical protein
VIDKPAPDPHPPQLYDRRRNEFVLDEIERISI